MTDIVKVLNNGAQVYPQTHASAIIDLEQGANGKSAYEIWLAAGNTGTEAQFLASLKGSSGSAATIAVGTVTSGTTAAVTNAGTSSAAKFNFVLPKGDKGDPGQNATTTAVATTSANGLMASTDKTKLDGIAVGAQKNPGNATTTAAGLMSSADKVKLDGLSSITFEKVGTV